MTALRASGRQGNWTISGNAGRKIARSSIATLEKSFSLILLCSRMKNMVRSLSSSPIILHKLRTMSSMNWNPTRTNLGK